MSEENAHCPACGAHRKGRIFTCEKCWREIPTNDRVQLAAMRRRGNETTSKLASVVRELKEGRA